MDNQYESRQDRRGRKRKRKLRVGRVFVAFLTILFITGGIYTVVQYKAGQALAEGSTIDPGEFQGDSIHPSYPSVENFLLLGIDDDGSEKSRTDTMMVLSWDKGEGTMRIVSFMRDIYAEIPGYQSYKLNTAYYLGGVQTAKDTITGMFGVPIHHYAIVDFDNFESVVDIAFPDGVEIDVEKEMSEKIYMTIEKGRQKLDGKKLLGYVRFRADSEGDFGRVRRQQQAMAAMKKEAVKPSMLLKAPKLTGALSEYIQTDLSAKDEMIRAVQLLLKGGADVETMTVPVENSYSFKNYRHAGSVIEVNRETNREAIASFLQLPLN